MDFREEASRCWCKDHPKSVLGRASQGEQLEAAQRGRCLIRGFTADTQTSRTVCSVVRSTLRLSFVFMLGIRELMEP